MAGRGRPFKELDEEQIEALAGIGCTDEEIAVALKCSSDTLVRRYKEHLIKGREKCKTSVRRMQWKTAESGNCTMQIWLGKQLLGQRDHNDITSGGKPVALAPIVLDGEREL
jgi:hypothetical protein